MNKKYFSHTDLENFTQEILRQMHKEAWVPDYVVGLTRGGLIPAVYISHYFDIPMYTLKVSLRDNPDTESNLWLAEEAFGYTGDNDAVVSNANARKNILIVDDINDTGNTLNWIIDDWQRSCLPHAPNWVDVWGQNVKFAVLVDNLSSKFKRKVNYCGTEIDKENDPSWIVFPYEEWWK